MRAAALGVILAFDEPPDFPDPLFPMMLGPARQFAGRCLLYYQVYLLCFVFIWVRSTLPRLRADQLMQFAWLILIPITLFNILLTGLIYLVVSSLALGNLTNLAFLVVVGIVNWAMLFAFIWIVRRATSATTRRALAPAIRAQRRATPATQIPERAGAPGGGQ